LLPNGKDESVTNVVRDIARRAQANAEEKGLQTLFVSLGMATWDASDGGRPADVPFSYFRSLSKLKARILFLLAALAQCRSILVLLHVLDTQFGVKVNSEDLIAHLRGDDKMKPFDTAPLYDELRRLANMCPALK